MLANFIVTTEFDELDANPGGDLADLSLREAISLAEAAAGPDTISFAPALQGSTISLNIVGDNSLGASLLRVASDISIVGPVELTRAGSDARLFLVDAGATLTLNTLSLTNGRAKGGDGGESAAGGGGGAAGLGGAIYSQGEVIIQASTLSGNVAQGGNGGRSGVAGLSRGGASGGSLRGNGANPTNDNGVAGTNGGGSGGNLVSGGQIVVGGDGGAAGFGSGGGGGGFGVSSGGANSFHGGGIGGAGGFGGGGGGVGRGSGGQNYASRSNSAAGFGGGFGSDNGGGGGAGLGGAIFNAGGTLTITNSTLSGNSAAGGNGGAGSGGTFAGQGGYGFGGGVFNRDGSVTITSATLANNAVSNGSGSNSNAGGTAIYNLQSTGTATVNVISSILASTDFRSDAVNDQGTITGSNNLIEQNSNFPAAVIVSSAAPNLGPLQFNGGPTRTHALLTGSAAIDAGGQTASLEPINLARLPGVVASQSSTLQAFTADLAINGLNNDFTHTSDTDSTPSWQIAIPFNATIQSVSIHNREDCCQGRLRDITVEILDNTGSVVFTSAVLNPRATAGNDANVGPADLMVTNIPANTVGRTVRITRTPQSGLGNSANNNVLSLGEVVVQGLVPLITDQRGLPLGRVSGAALDIGAFEALTQPALVVSTLVDELDTDLSNGDLSLREAIALANVSSDADTITFDPTVFATAQTISLTLGQLAISGSLTITGPGQRLLTIDAQQSSRIFDISNTAGDVTLSGLTLTGGRGGITQHGGAVRTLSSGLLTIAQSTLTGNSVIDPVETNAYGGAIFVRNGNLAVTDSILSGNSAAYGGAIYLRSGSDVTISRSSLSGNTASIDGGAFYAGIGGQSDISITDSTLSGNTATTRRGGAIASPQYGNVTITNSTLSGNRVLGTPTFGGGAIFFNGGDVTITNSTITGNSANIGGGIGINPNDDGESLTIRNSLIAGNTATTNPDFTAPVNPATNLTVAFSIIGDNSGTTLAGVATAGADGNLIGIPVALINPLLGPLQNNGGSTQTHALLTGSPAINAGSNSLVPSGTVNDQRGIGFPRISQTTVDIGAFEQRPLAGFTIVESDGTTQVSESGTTDTFTVVLTSAPTSNVVLTVVSGNAGEASVDQATLTFTPANFATPQTVTVTGVNDAVRDGSQSTNVTIAVDDANSDDTFDTLADQVVAVTTTDDETSTLLVVQSGGSTSVLDSGATDTFTVALSSAPLTNVVVTVSLNNTTHASLNTATLTFTPANFATPQTVTVTGTNDNVINGNQTAVIAIAVNNAASDVLWANVTAPSINVTIIEGSLDLGDAPAPYPTLLPNGASHQAVGPTLGTRRDVEADGQPNATATGDDAAVGFADAVRVASGSAGNTTSTAVGDLNGDGNLDLLISISGDSTVNPVIPDSLAVLLGNGSGSFGAPTQVPSGTGTGAIFVVLDDFNGDTRLDAAVLNGSSNDVSLLLGNGDGTFQAAIVISLGSVAPTTATGVNQIASANVGGSSAPDLLIVGSISDDVTVLINNGDGTFAAPQSYPTFATPPGIGGGGFSLIVQDLNGDGNQDVAVANFASNDITVMLNSGTGTFPNVRANLIDPTNTNGAMGPGTVVAGNFGGDANIDLLTANAMSGDLTLLIGNGSDTFTAQSPIALPGSGPGVSFLTTILARDLNGDGNLDAIVTDQGTVAGGAVYVLLGNGNGTFQPATRLTGGLTTDDSPFRLSIADLNRDGNAELIADVGTGVAIFSLGLGDEDGVTFPSAAIGSAAQGSVTVNLQNADPASNVLDAWIDFNRNGDWNDAGEQIFNARSLGTTNGPQTLTFDLPAGIVTGTSFARFRISTAGISTPGGFVADGEVEDYQVSLVTPVVSATLDFGDAPAAYPVTLASNGARHTVGALFLGATIDTELDGSNSVAADADGNDDDGVFVIASLISASLDTISSFSVIASAPGKLDAWVDFDNNGSWLDAGEQIFNSVDVVAGTNLLSFTIPAGLTASSTGARFRLSTVGNLVPTGLAADGEVEDYLAAIVIGSGTTKLDINVPAGDSTVAVEGDNLVVRRGTDVLFQAPFAAFGDVDLNGTSLDDIFQVTILEALASRVLSFAGGLGRDLLELIEAGQTLDLTNANITLTDIETIDISGTGNNRLVVSIEAVKAASSTTDTLEVVANGGDTVDFGNRVARERWQAEVPMFIDDQFTHIITERATDGTARVEIRNDRLFQNPLNRFDVDRDGTVSARDALRIINELRRRINRNQPPQLEIPTNDGEISRFYFDVNGRNDLTALDALFVINAIVRIRRNPDAEGEAAAPLIDLNQFSNPSNEIRERTGASLRSRSEAADLAIQGLVAFQPRAIDATTTNATMISAIDDLMTELDIDETLAVETLNPSLLSSLQ